MASSDVNIKIKLQVAELRKQLKGLKKELSEVNKDLKKQQKDVATANKAQVKHERDLFALKTKQRRQEHAAQQKAYSQERKREKEKLTFAQKANRLAFGRQGAGALMPFGMGGAGGGLAQRGMLGSANRVGGRVALGAVGLAGALGTGMLGLAAGSAVSGYQRLTQYRQTLANSVGLGLGNLQGIRGRAGLGYTSVEAAGRAAATARAGAVGRGQGAHVVDTSMAMSRLTNMDEGEVAGYMGAARQTGSKFGTGSDRNSLVGIFSTAVKEGIEESRMGEFFGDVTKLTQMAAGNGITDLKSNNIPSLLLFMEKAGLKGQHASQTAANLQQGIVGMGMGGGDSRMRQTVMRATGFGGPGQGGNYFESLKAMQGGILKDPALLGKVINQVMREAPSMQAGAARFAELGINQENAEKLITAHQSGQDISGLAADMQKESMSEKDLIKMAAEKFADAGTGIAHLVKSFERSMKIGEEFAKHIEGLEDLQFDTIEEFLEQFPELSKGIGELIDVMRKSIPILISTMREVFDWMKNTAIPKLEAMFGDNDPKDRDRLKWAQKTGNKTIAYKEAIRRVWKEKHPDAMLPESIVDDAASKMMKHGVDISSQPVLFNAAKKALWPNVHGDFPEKNVPPAKPRKGDKKAKKVDATTEGAQGSVMTDAVDVVAKIVNQERPDISPPLGQFTSRFA